MKVSVIIPVYKAEAYIVKCLDSVLNQTLKDFEIILVDDGSPDRCGEICDDYAQKDRRIKVFHTKNSGVASARQLGMDKAMGDYVIHIDPDDWVEPAMLEELYNKALEDDSDVVLCDYWINNVNIVKQQPSTLHHLVVLKELFQHLHGSCWNKLLRRSCYIDQQTKFYTELTYCEDLTFWCQIFTYNIKVSYLNKAFYHYNNHSGSICKTHMNYQKDRDWKVIKILKYVLRDYNDILKIALSKISYFIVADAFYYGAFTTLSFTRRYYKYAPYILNASDISLRTKLRWARICLGLYGYYKKKYRETIS